MLDKISSDSSKIPGPNSLKAVAVFGGGCFWCTEAVFKMLKGVYSVDPGYAGGTAANPTYEQVSTGKTGHAEAVRVEYDPAIVPYERLLTIFFASHDPTTLNRQGADVGSQYRSVVFYTSSEQKEIAEKYIADLNQSSKFGDPIVTEVQPLDIFYEAENYHKDYLAHHPNQPYCLLVINPKLEKVKHQFAELLKEQN
jgi:peptide-methionine (S)-S-oxide reductase